MRRAIASAVAALLLCLVAAPSALAHSAFLGSTPEPGTRLADSPRLVSLVFTERLSDRLSKATLVRVSDGRVAAGVRSTVSGTRLVLELVKPLERGAYRVQWHTVSTEDGHALEGSFSFGVGAAAVGSEHDVVQSPLARDGWLRVLARGVMYATLLLFAGALMLDVLLSRRGGSWLVPDALIAAAPTLDTDRVQRRHRRLVVDVGLLAVAAAAASAVADAEDAAGGFSVRGASDFLLFNVSGLSRVYTVGLLVLAAMLAALRLRAAAVASLGAMGAVALSGHANAASPRGLAVANDWVHLSATALWLGGIAVIVIVWGPLLRRSAQGDRLAVARHVLPRFGRVALPAFLVVVATGLVSAVIQLGEVRALWETDYGRVLMVKVDLVAFIAAASYRHALRLRPRLLSANRRANSGLDRRHWRLLRAEPVLGVGVVAAVALLVAFPLPPRQLGDADAAGAGAPPAAACSPCPLPSPRQDELAVADQGGSDVVAAWVRRAGDALLGTVRLYGLDDRPVSDRLVVLGARQTSCGPGCARFAHRGPVPAVVKVRVLQKGRSYLARLPVRWRAGEQVRARRLVERAQSVMRALASVRQSERASSVPGLYALTNYRLEAPDRMAYRTNGGAQSVVVGVRQWTRGQPDAPWQRSEFGGGLPFRTRSWFTWTTYARNAYVLGERREGRRRVAVVALMDPGTPAWWRLVIDLDTHRVLRDRLVTYGHFMTQRFWQFNRPLRIQPPGRRKHGN
jgi:copper transport protein